MAVSVEDIAEVDKILSTDAQVGLPDLKAKFPHLAWTRCDASDVVESPFRTYTHYEIHLLDSKDHCVQVTDNPEHATGFVLAKRS